jgi:hypothetical protein
MSASNCNLNRLTICLPMFETSTSFFSERIESGNRDLECWESQSAREIGEEIARNVVFGPEYVDQNGLLSRDGFDRRPCDFSQVSRNPGGLFAMGGGVGLGTSSAMASGVSHVPATQPKTMTAAHASRLTFASAALPRMEMGPSPLWVAQSARRSWITARKAGPYFCSLTAPTP